MLLQVDQILWCHFLVDLKNTVRESAFHISFIPKLLLLTKSRLSKISYGIEISQYLVSEHCFIDFDTFYPHALIFVVQNTETLKQKLWKEQCQRE